MWTSRIVFGLLSLSMGAMSIAALVSRAESGMRARYVAVAPSQLDRLKPGETARISGKLKGPEKQTSAFQQLPCVAYWTDIDATLEYSDSDGTKTEYDDVIEQKRGPEVLQLVAGQRKIHIALSLWRKRRAALERSGVQKLPKSIPAYEPGHDRFLGYSISEAVLREGASLFVIGAVHEIDGKTIELGPDIELGGLELISGTQQQLVKILEGEVKGAGVGALVAAGAALLFLSLLVLFEVKARR